jgi:hypothetical protein
MRGYFDAMVWGEVWRKKPRSLWKERFALWIMLETEVPWQCRISCLGRSFSFGSICGMQAQFRVDHIRSLSAILGVAQSSSSMFMCEQLAVILYSQ